MTAKQLQANQVGAPPGTDGHAMNGKNPANSYAPALQHDRLRIVAPSQENASASEDKRFEKERAAASYLAAIVESAEDAIASKDLNGIISSWNRAAERMFGYKAEEIIGKSVTLIIPPELHNDEEMILAKIRRGERIEHFKTVRITKSGRRIDVSLTVSPIKDDRGKIIGAAKIVRDITESKRTEEALRHAERMAATGQLAATIAHEINNPMQALTNLLSLLRCNTSLDDSTLQLVSLAEAELSRMAHIARQMLSFYRESSTPVPVKMAEVLDDVLELFMTRLKSKEIRVERRYEFDGDVKGFPVELRQLAANLVSNAIEAAGRKGHISIHLLPCPKVATLHRSGVRMVIVDDGPGIKPELRNRIFEPFFTTKAEKGTGLGLWVVKGIVAKHGGSIRMRSRTATGRSGSLFSVFLPLSYDL
jgi:two-component system, chemotaxis family, CheB/CheR fusion protein